jgi:hypothetical protein
LLVSSVLERGLFTVVIMNHLREAIIRKLLLQRIDHICSDVVFFVISAVMVS